MNQESADIDIAGSFIAEIPNGEDAHTFEFNPDGIPVLPLFDTVTFPGLPQPIKLEGDQMLTFVEHLYEAKASALAIPVKEDVESPTKVKDFYPVGVVSKVVKVIKIDRKSVV